MSTDDALRFLEHEARVCRDRDAHEALCLLVPALLKACDLKPANGYQVEEIRRELRELVRSDFRFDRGTSLLHHSEENAA